MIILKFGLHHTINIYSVEVFLIVRCTYTWFKKKNFKWMQPSYRHLILLVPLPKHNLKIWNVKWCCSDYKTLLKIILSLSAILENMCILSLLLVILFYFAVLKTKTSKNQIIRIHRLLKYFSCLGKFIIKTESQSLQFN